jgi:hypothetical protein
MRSFASRKKRAGRAKLTDQAAAAKNNGLVSGEARKLNFYIKLGQALE